VRTPTEARVGRENGVGRSDEQPLPDSVCPTLPRRAPTYCATLHRAASHCSAFSVPTGRRISNRTPALVERRGAGIAFHNDRTLCVHISLHAVSHVTRKGRLRLMAALAALSISLIGCEAVVNEVRVEPGTTPLKPVFVLTDTTGRGPPGTIYGLSIVACGTETVLWQIAATGSNGAPSRIEYGVTPPGYVVNAGPAPLHAGCYDVFVTDGRRARFRVDVTGRVTPESRRDTARR
jgi:hypothetical protein